MSKRKPEIGKTNQIRDRYEKLAGKRTGFLSRARDFANFTLPHIISSSDEPSYDGQDNTYGWENIGAEACNHLSNKLASTLFPISHDFFSLELSADAEADLENKGINKTSLNVALRLAMKKAKEVERRTQGRLAIYQVCEHLIVTGNVLLAYLDGKLQAIPLDRYVVNRDRAGKLIEVIILETKSLENFPSHIREKLKHLNKTRMKKEKKPTEDLELFTRAKLKDGIWEVDQEVEGCKLSKTQRVSEIPFLALRWKHNYGEDYGRGLVENHAGDYFVISFLSEAIIKGMALMSDVKYLVRAGSQVDIDEFLESETGSVLYGHADDITILQLDKYADFTPISNVLEEYKKRIGRAFLMNSQVRRDAERVTTVELRMDAVEMEGALGGTYTTLDIELQEPLAKFYLKESGFTSLEHGIVPLIKTGMEALGRSGDLEDLYTFSEVMQLPNGWAEGAQARVKWDAYMSNVSRILGMDAPFIKTEAELQKERQQQQAQETEQAMQDGMIDAVSGAVNQPQQ